MKSCPFSVIPFLFGVAILLPVVCSDLTSDKQALLDFADAVPHRRNFSWNPATPVCTSWVGVNCTPNGTRVTSLRLPGVGLVGSVPPNTLGKLDALRILSLRSNLLRGDLPSDITSLPSLQYLYLQRNNFSGHIPTSFSPQLNVLDLSFNSFTGNIPQTVRNLTQLTGLSLQNNTLSGPIPDLKLPKLKRLNLSYNHLNGSIPPSLQHFPNSSFVGNSLLCGGPLKACSIVLPPPPPTSNPPPPVSPQKKSSKKKLKLGYIIAIAAGGAVLLLLLGLIIVLCCLKKKDNGGTSVLKGKSSTGGRSEKPKEEFGSGVQEPEKNKLVFFEGCSYNFDLDDLLRASAEVLGKGSYGTAYKAVLEEATTVVVKRLKEVVVGKRDFEQQMEIVGRVGQHANVVPLRAYYYSKDEKLLVYDYISNGSLSALLHGNRGSERPSLDWESRVKISLGTARGNVASISEKLLPRHDLEHLSVDECWSIIKDGAFLNSSDHITLEFRTVGMEIAKNCGGVPLMAKVLGGILHTKKSIEEWSLFKNSIIWHNLSKEEDRIMRVLKLSFDNLESPSLKQCFSYCSMFEKDFEIQRENLIQLWMAQGLLHSLLGESKDMEDIGNEYFDILLQRSLFQDAGMSHNGIVRKYKMHDLVHDMAELVSKSESLTGDLRGIDNTNEIRHVARVSTSMLDKLPEISARKLRSLFFDDGEVPSNILARFKALRVLNLSNANIEEFPISVGMLKHLRYLDISETRFKSFPKSIGKLYNLQTLRAKNCALKEFPKELQNLTNLRHIYFDESTKFPQGISRLTCLRTLPYFSVGNEIGRQIEELAGLKQLKGKLIIHNLEHVKNGEEAKKAKLHDKREVCHLSFKWTKDSSITSNNEEGDVLEGLRPHPGLESLCIENFMGDRFPSWMMRRPLLLNNLKGIKLLGCDKCEGVPPLGHLPKLTELEIRGMDNLKCVGAEFYGYDLVHNVAMTSKEKITLFPALKVLHIVKCNNLIEWMEAPMMSTQKVVVFPCLEELDIKDCSKLRNVPSHFPSLQKLVINSSDSGTPIEEISSELTTLVSLEIGGIKELTCLPQGILKNNNNLSSLGISKCDDLTCIAPDVFGSCGSLKRLSIWRCKKLRHLLDGLDTLPLLEYLSIWGCDSLELIPITQGMTSLRKLHISDCKQLSGLPITQGMTSLRELHISDCKQLADGLDIPPLLENLSIRWCPSLELIPIAHGMASLRELEIEYCGRLSGLPSGIRYCPSLQKLHLQGCDGVTSFPFYTLASLRRLYIYECNGLSGPLSVWASLMDLKIESCRNLTSIEIKGGGVSSLMDLNIQCCRNLTSIEIKGGGVSSLMDLNIVHCRNLTSIEIKGGVSSLQKLIIRECEELSSLPALPPSLKVLIIEDCDGLSGPLSVRASLVELEVKRCDNLTSIEIKGGVSSLQKLDIRDCEELSSLPALPQQCLSLKELWISDCPKVAWFGVQSNSISLQSFSDLRTFTSLRQLTIDRCEGLESWVSRLQFPLSLESLTIQDFPNLEILPSLDNLTSLRYLGIRNWRKLKDLPTGLQWPPHLEGLSIGGFGGFWEELDSFPDFQVGSLMHLKRLYLNGWPKLKSLPQQIQHLTSLTSLSVYDFDGVETLPEWLGSLTSLTYLEIYYCKNLTNLPSVQAMQRLTKLQTLRIYPCHPLLKQRCSRDSGTEWPKISHIPEIMIW